MRSLSLIVLLSEWDVLQAEVPALALTWLDARTHSFHQGHELFAMSTLARVPTGREQR